MYSLPFSFILFRCCCFSVELFDMFRVVVITCIHLVYVKVAIDNLPRTIYGRERG